MEKISWSPDFSVGILEIDRQHKELINLINKSIESINSVRNVEIVAEILSEMVSYANYHFETEEQYMREHNYPDYLIQKEQHSQFVEKTIFTPVRLAMALIKFVGSTIHFSALPV